MEWWKVFVAGDCAWCSGYFVAVAASLETASRYCSTQCRENAGKSRSGRFVIPRGVRLAIYERDKWTCQLCGDPVDPDLPTSHPWAATLDHIECRSWSLIPDDSPRNLRLAHRWCNSVRGNERFHSADVLAA